MKPNPSDEEHDVHINWTYRYCAISKGPASLIVVSQDRLCSLQTLNKSFSLTSTDEAHTSLQEWKHSIKVLIVKKVMKTHDILYFRKVIRRPFTYFKVEGLEKERGSVWPSLSLEPVESRLAPCFWWKKRNMAETLKKCHLEAAAASTSSIGAPPRPSWLHQASAFGWSWWSPTDAHEFISFMHAYIDHSLHTKHWV